MSTDDIKKALADLYREYKNSGSTLLYGVWVENKVIELRAEKAEMVEALPSTDDWADPEYCMCDSCSLTFELLAKYEKESKP